MTHSPALRAPLRALVLTTAVLLPALLLGGCGALYNDTKGWANRLEAKILQTTHETGEPDPAEAPESLAEPAQLTPPLPLPKPMAEPPQESPPALLPMTPDPGMLAAPAPTGEAAPVPGLMPMTPDPGVIAQAAVKNGENPLSGKETKALPPRPLPKPEVPAMAMAKPEKPAGKPEQTATAGTAHAVVLHLSSLRSEAAAKREWSDLQHNFPRPLADMQAEIRRTELGDKGTFYRVLAGPLPSQDKARQVCAALKSKDAKQYCRILPSGPDAS